MKRTIPEKMERWSEEWPEIEIVPKEGYIGVSLVEYNADGKEMRRERVSIEGVDYNAIVTTSIKRWVKDVLMPKVDEKLAVKK